MDPGADRDEEGRKEGESGDIDAEAAGYGAGAMGTLGAIAARRAYAVGQSAGVADATVSNDARELRFTRASPDRDLLRTYPAEVREYVTGAYHQGYSDAFQASYAG